jgi:hypothetical protein
MTDSRNSSEVVETKPNSRRVRGRCVAIFVSLLAVSLFALLVWNGKVSLNCGLLRTSREMFLDSSGDIFQRVDWHLGNGTRTRGETYGMKISRAYLTLSVTHIRAGITPAQAREE